MQAPGRTSSGAAGSSNATAQGQAQPEERTNNHDAQQPMKAKRFSPPLLMVPRSSTIPRSHHDQTLAMLGLGQGQGLLSSPFGAGAYDEDADSNSQGPLTTPSGLPSRDLSSLFSTGASIHNLQQSQQEQQLPKACGSLPLHARPGTSSNKDANAAVAASSGDGVVPGLTHTSRRGLLRSWSAAPSPQSRMHAAVLEQAGVTGSSGQPAGAHHGGVKVPTAASGELAVGSVSMAAAGAVSGQVMQPAEPDASTGPSQGASITNGALPSGGSSSSNQEAVEKSSMSAPALRHSGTLRADASVFTPSFVALSQAMTSAAQPSTPVSKHQSHQAQASTAESAFPSSSHSPPATGTGNTGPHRPSSPQPHTPFAAVTLPAPGHKAVTLPVHSGGHSLQGDGGHDAAGSEGGEGQAAGSSAWALQERLAHGSTGGGSVGAGLGRSSGLKSNRSEGRREELDMQMTGLQERLDKVLDSKSSRKPISSRKSSSSKSARPAADQLNVPGLVNMVIENTLDLQAKIGNQCAVLPAVMASTSDGRNTESADTLHDSPSAQVKPSQPLDNGVLATMYGDLKYDLGKLQGLLLPLQECWLKVHESESLIVPLGAQVRCVLGLFSELLRGACRGHAEAVIAKLASIKDTVAQAVGTHLRSERRVLAEMLKRVCMLAELAKDACDYLYYVTGTLEEGQLQLLEQGQGDDDPRSMELDIQEDVIAMAEDVSRSMANTAKGLHACSWTDLLSIDDEGGVLGNDDLYDLRRQLLMTILSHAPRIASAIGPLALQISLTVQDVLSEAFLDAARHLHQVLDNHRAVLPKRQADDDDPWAMSNPDLDPAEEDHEAGEHGQLMFVPYSLDDLVHGSGWLLGAVAQLLHHARKAYTELCNALEAAGEPEDHGDDLWIALESKQTMEDEFMHLVMATLHRTERLGKACLGCVSLSSLEVVQQQVQDTAELVQVYKKCNLGPESRLNQPGTTDKDHEKLSSWLFQCNMRMDQVINVFFFISEYLDYRAPKEQTTRPAATAASKSVNGLAGTSALTTYNPATDISISTSLAGDAAAAFPDAAAAAAAAAVPAVCRAAVDMQPALQAGGRGPSSTAGSAFREPPMANASLVALGAVADNIHHLAHNAEMVSGMGAAGGNVASLHVPADANDGVHMPAADMPAGSDPAPAASTAAAGQHAGVSEQVAANVYSIMHEEVGVAGEGQAAPCSAPSRTASSRGLHVHADSAADVSTTTTACISMPSPTSRSAGKHVGADIAADLDLEAGQPPGATATPAIGGDAGMGVSAIGNTFTVAEAVHPLAATVAKVSAAALAAAPTIPPLQAAAAALPRRLASPFGAGAFRPGPATAAPAPPDGTAIAAAAATAAGPAAATGKGSPIGAARGSPFADVQLMPFSPCSIPGGRPHGHFAPDVQLVQGQATQQPQQQPLSVVRALDTAASATGAALVGSVPVPHVVSVESIVAYMAQLPYIKRSDLTHPTMIRQQARNSNLGRGGYAKVFEILYFHAPVAAKVLDNIDPLEFKREVTIHDMINRHPNIVRLLGYSVGELRPARVKPPALEKKPAAATSTATTAQATQQQQQHQAAIPVSRPRANNQSTQGQASASSQAAAAQAAKPQLFIIMELYGGARVRGWRNNENSLYKTVALASEAMRSLREPGARMPGAIENKLATQWLARVDVAVGIASALAYMHDKGVVHGDLTSWNVLLDQVAKSTIFTPKVCDFGMSRLVRRGQRLSYYSTLINSPAYQGPELVTHTVALLREMHPTSAIEGEPPPRPQPPIGPLLYDPFANDVYGFGVILHEVLTLQHAYSEETSKWNVRSGHEMHCLLTNAIGGASSNAAPLRLRALGLDDLHAQHAAMEAAVAKRRLALNLPAVAAAPMPGAVAGVAQLMQGALVPAAVQGQGQVLGVGAAVQAAAGTAPMLGSAAAAPAPSAAAPVQTSLAQAQGAAAASAPAPQGSGAKPPLAPPVAPLQGAQPAAGAAGLPTGAAGAALPSLQQQHQHALQTHGSPGGSRVSSLQRSAAAGTAAGVVSGACVVDRWPLVENELRTVVDVMHACLRDDPTQRPCMEEVATSLKCAQLGLTWRN